MRGFFSRLKSRVSAVDSLLCVGLDPHPEFLSDPSAEAAREFCFRLIDATSTLVCAYKPNSAFFEVYGSSGWSALAEVIAAVPDGIPVILDAKRGDIASSSRLYAQAIFEALGADAVTVNPYLGHDAVAPFIEDPGKGIFLLCKTSNPGASEVQSVNGASDPLYLRVAQLASTWNTNDNVGLVVGATDPQALAAVRALSPELWFLAPGVGPQGADLRAAMESGLDSEGLGMVIPVSRAVAAAESPAREAASIRGVINRVRSAAYGAGMKSPKGVGEAGSLSNRHPSPLSPEKASLADELLDVGCVKFGDYRLKSGTNSPIYFDLRLLSSRPELLARAADAYVHVLSDLKFDRLAAIPYAGIPIATAVSLRSGWPMVYPRKERKGYGTGNTVEGGHLEREVVALIDDLVTTAGSKLDAAEKLAAAGLSVKDIVVLIDREAGAHDLLEAEGLRLHAVFSITQLLDHWAATGAVNGNDLARVTQWLTGAPSPASNPGL